MHEGQLKTESLTESLDRLELEEEYSKGDPSRFDISVKSSNEFNSQQRSTIDGQCISASVSLYLGRLAENRKTVKQEAGGR